MFNNWRFCTWDEPISVHSNYQWNSDVETLTCNTDYDLSLRLLIVRNCFLWNPQEKGNHGRPINIQKSCWLNWSNISNTWNGISHCAFIITTIKQSPRCNDPNTGLILSIHCWTSRGTPLFHELVQTLPMRWCGELQFMPYCWLCCAG